MTLAQLIHQSNNHCSIGSRYRAWQLWEHKCCFQSNWNCDVPAPIAMYVKQNHKWWARSMYSIAPIIRYWFWIDLFFVFRFSYYEHKLPENCKVMNQFNELFHYESSQLKCYFGWISGLWSKEIKHCLWLKHFSHIIVQYVVFIFHLVSINHRWLFLHFTMNHAFKFA